MQTLVRAAAVHGARDIARGGLRTVSLYLEMAKARLGLLVLLTTLVGFLLAAGARVDARLLTWTLVGTALASAGANILNQWWEADRDRLMLRTRGRPIPSGRIAPAVAAVWGVLSCLAGVLVLGWGATPLSAVLALLVIVLYVLVYTPLKTRTPLCTVVGAVCGALPAMLGWSAATGGLEAGSLLVGGIVFLWQVPHSLSLAWHNRLDYQRGGYRLLPRQDPDGVLTGRIVLVWTLALLPVGAAGWLYGFAGLRYLAASLLAGSGLAYLAWRLYRQHNDAAARSLFLASIVYLPLVLLALVVS